MGDTKTLEDNQNVENSARTIEIEKESYSTDKSNQMSKIETNRPILVLINPHSGLGKSVTIYRKKLLPFFYSHNIDHQVFITESDSRVGDFLLSKSLLELGSYRSILVVSGDGLFHETINALMSRPDWKQAISVPIGIVPTGSGNGLAYTLIRQRHPELTSKDDVIQICCDQAIQNNTSLADLVKITFGRGSTTWSFLSFGWGLLSDIDIDSEWLRKIGELRFTIYGLIRSLTSVSYRGKLSYKAATSSVVTKNSSSNNGLTGEIDDNIKFVLPGDDGWVHIEDKFACVYAVYQTYVSSVTKFAPKSTLTDQLIYLTYIRGKLNPCKVVEFLLSIKDGSHEFLPYVTVVPVTSFKLQPLESSKIVVDGEVIPWNLADGQISAEVVPQVVKLLWTPQQPES